MIKKCIEKTLREEPELNNPPQLFHKNRRTIDEFIKSHNLQHKEQEDIVGTIHRLRGKKALRKIAKEYRKEGCPKRKNNIFYIEKRN